MTDWDEAFKAGWQACAKAIEEQVEAARWAADTACNATGALEADRYPVVHGATAQHDNQWLLDEFERASRQYEELPLHARPIVTRGRDGAA